MDADARRRARYRVHEIGREAERPHPAIRHK